MLKKSIIIGLTLAISVSLTACGGEKASFDDVENSRVRAKENSALNAKRFRSENKLDDKWTMVKRGDSTISAKCPQGDGWASLDFINGNETIELKCSTVSLGLGCIKKSEFVTKSYGTQENNCNNEIPFPLPRLGE